MRIDWDVPIAMDDGLVLRADVFRPADDGRYPVIMTYGPYAKWLAFQDGFARQWAHLAAEHPDALTGSSNRYQNWETVDPENWVPDGYVVIRVDSRGAGRSPGYLDIFSPRETLDYYECIEWAAVQPWCTGKVGLLGVSYYAINQWQVAALQPPHLTAICPWEGGSDFYRDFTRHGGILNVFVRQWYPPQVAGVQHGVGDGGPRHRMTGGTVAGPDTLTEDERQRNRADTPAAVLAHSLDDDYYRQRSPDLARITVPVLSAANWAHHLHTRGNFEGYRRVASSRKWLEVHGRQHWVEFYTEYGVRLQKRFFGHFLKGEDTGWDAQPPVVLQVRQVDGSFIERAETGWPLPRTQWTRFHLDLAAERLAMVPDAVERTSTFDALGDGLTFWTEPLEHDVEITGPGAARLTVASSTSDADLFLTLRVADPAGRDVTFASGQDPHGCVGFGWLRASQRKTDPARSLAWRPWHTHDQQQPLTPGEPVDVDVEIWPTSVLIPAGYRLGVTAAGRDFELAGDGPWPSAFGVSMRGNGIFVHTDPADRPADIFGGQTTLVSGGSRPGYLLLPVIPQK
ncbi:MAG TPA: CocE/NonD family hydrolase [Streptosporangiaceae bacterium]|nr:CocE/NonD family hydrolase [Streptosporangiaceae bacterium]